MLAILKSLADPCRLRLVAVLMRGEFTVQELTRILRLGQSRISRHLKILTDAGVLTVKRQGTWSYYRVAEGEGFFTSICPALERELDTLPQRDADLSGVAAVLEERRSKSRSFFDRHAAEWDDLARALLPMPDYRERLLSLVPEGEVVLEVGIGTGSLVPHLAARSSKLIGVDHSPAMLDEARRRLEGAGEGKIDLRLGEMTHLPLPDRSVGVAVANMVLHHAADPGAVLREMARVLRPGGVLVLADLARHEREWVRERLADQWLGFGEEELEGWLQAAGFAAPLFERMAGKEGEEAVLLVKACFNER